MQCSMMNNIPIAKYISDNILVLILLVRNSISFKISQKKYLMPQASHFPQLNHQIV